MKNETENITKKIDARGLLCPLPVLKLRKNLQEMAAGHLLEIVTTDPVANIDIPHFCAQEGHKLIETKTNEDATSFIICKKK